MNNIKIIKSYVDYIVNYDFSLICDEQMCSKLRLGAMFLDRVYLAYNKKIIYRDTNIIDLVEELNIEPITDIEDKIKYLITILNTLTNKDHPLLVFMFFGCDSIKSNIYYKFKY